MNGASAQPSPSAQLTPDVDALQLFLQLMSSFSFRSADDNNGTVPYKALDIPISPNGSGITCDFTGQKDVPKAPLAMREGKNLTQHGDTRIDNYYWMRSEKGEGPSPSVMKHIQDENNFTSSMMNDTQELQAQIMDEVNARITDETSVPTRDGRFYYYTKQDSSQNLKVSARRPVPNDQMSSAYMETHEMDTSLDETILLDANKMKEAGNHSYFRIGSSEVSLNHELLAWTQDTEGSEKYSLHVKGISNDTEIIPPVENTFGRGFGWAADSMTLFYTALDMFGRPSKVQRSNVFTGDDETVFKTQSPGLFPLVRAEDNAIYISLAGEQDLPVQQLFVLSDRPGDDFKRILPPKRGMNYAATLSNGYFYIQLSGEDQPNGKVIAAPMDAPHDMKVLLPESNSSLLEGMIVKNGYVGTSERDNGLTTMKAYRIPKDGSPPTPFNRDEPLRRLTFDEPTYTLRGVPVLPPDSPVVRVWYTSLTTPKQIIEFNLETGNRVVKDSEKVPEFKRDDYKSERIWATSADGTEVPVSLVYRKDLLQIDGSNPLLLEGYGGSGLVAEAAFRTNRLSILDRGIIYAIAHVRGSRYLGERWFEDGKLLNKRNTFMDFIAVADHLIKQNYTSPEQLAIQGASAGGTLVLAVLNKRPELFAAGIAEVPPTDLISLFSDNSESIAVLLRSEYGNPKENETVYDYMLTYSPYDNIRSDTPYPHLYVRGGTEDSRVPFWEPVKYVAKLRQAQADRLKEAGPFCNYLNRLLLLDMNMDVGHVLPGRDFATKRFATNLAFMLKSIGMQEKAPIPGSAGNGTSMYNKD